MAGKRKAAEPAGAAPAHEHRADGSPEVGLTVATTDSPPDDGDDDDAGPMTKAKKRKGTTSLGSHICGGIARLGTACKTN